MHKHFEWISKNLVASDSGFQRIHWVSKNPVELSKRVAQRITRHRPGAKTFRPLSVHTVEQSLFNSAHSVCVLSKSLLDFETHPVLQRKIESRGRQTHCLGNVFVYFSLPHSSERNAFIAVCVFVFKFTLPDLSEAAATDRSRRPDTPANWALVQ